MGFTENADTAQRLDHWISVRRGSQVWAKSEVTLEAWERGDPLRVPPVSLEYAPTIECSCACPTCPFRAVRARSNSGRRDIDADVIPNGTTVATWDITRRILDNAKSAGVAGFLITGGGEPTIWPHLQESAEYAGDLGMTTGIYTNGIRFGLRDDFADAFVRNDSVAWIRVSINCVSPAVIRRHWGVADARDVLVQLDGLRNLLEARQRRNPTANRSHNVSVAVSVIVDRHNVNDLTATLGAIADVYGDFRNPQADDVEDAVIVRPLIDHSGSSYSLTQHSPETIASLLSQCGPDAAASRKLQRVGVPMYLGFGLNEVLAGNTKSFTDVVCADYEKRSTRSLGYGLFLAVASDGSLYSATEAMGDPKWRMGDMTKQSVQDIYASQTRRDFMSRAEECRWGPSMFPPFTRWTRLDRIAEWVNSGYLTDDIFRRIQGVAQKEHSLLLS